MDRDVILEKLVQKIRSNMDAIGQNLMEFPEGEDGLYFDKPDESLPLRHIFNWTQSFYTGYAYWAYRLTKDESILKWLYAFYDEYEKKVFETPMDTMHDLGFLYTPYAVALYGVTGDPNMKKIAIKAADELAKRFVPSGSFIQAWGRMDGTLPEYVSKDLAQNVFFAENKGRVILDSMMNLPLLFWASRESGHPFYQRIAVQHADMILKYFIREDDSVCHAFIFDTETGAVLREANSCGYANGSYWARGTGWAIYGFALAYSYTKDEKYLSTAIRLCRKFIEECKGELPVWDFRLPPSEPKNIDTSAAALVLCAILEITKHKPCEDLAQFAELMEEKLIPYINFDTQIHGILREQNGRHVYASYGDYYIVEYLCRKKLGCDTIW